MLRTTDPTFWRNELQRVKALGTMTRVKSHVELQIHKLEHEFEATLSAWQSNFPVLENDPKVYCPGCTAYTRHIRTEAAIQAKRKDRK